MSFKKKIKIHLSSGMQRFFLCYFLMLLSFYSVAQQFTLWDTIPVEINAQNLSMPWAGGFNNPQFSAIDINRDGVKDILVFDRSTKTLYPLINTGIADSVSYRFDPSFRSLFPEINQWVLLHDYNMDGRPDLFTSTRYGMNVGIKVYRNDTATNGDLTFSLIDSMIYADYNPGVFNLYVSEWDIPGLADVDRDGDLDILTFEYSGYFMEYFKNMSMEYYGVPDSLDFVLADKCWGKFEEGFGSCTVSLGVSCKGSGGHLRDTRHAGSTVLPIDINNDHAMDAIVGDINCNNPYLVTNGGDSLIANMIKVDSLYPVTEPVNIPRFPAVFYLDADNDGIKDLIAAPNALAVSENFKGTLWYKNTGTEAAPNFVYQRNDLFQRNMIEVGEGAYPVPFDYNHDSLQDIVIGNYRYYQSGGGFLSGLALFENTGTQTNPAFKLITRNYGNINSLLIKAVYPAFGDLDGDGDKDMIVGEENGFLHYFTNIAATGQDAEFSLTAPQFESIDVGQFSTPQLIDVDRDGLLDLIVGERSGNINYYHNIGTKSNPQFDLVSDYWGKVNVKRNKDLHGNSIPFLTVIDTSGDSVLLVGSSSGYIYEYDHLFSPDSTFTLIDSIFENIWNGASSSVSGVDLNHDKSIDLLLGNWGGGMAIYKNLNTAPSPPPPPVDTSGELSISIYPNPASKIFYIRFLHVKSSANTAVDIYDMLGHPVFRHDYPDLLGDSVVDIKFNSMPQGVYIIRIEVDAKYYFYKQVLL